MKRKIAFLFRDALGIPSSIQELHSDGKISEDLDSVLHIHLSEMGVNEEWIWKPDPKDPTLGKQIADR